MTAIDGGATQEDRQGLEEQRQFLLDSLRDLEQEREAGEITEKDYDTLRADYTGRAAAVLRALESVDAKPEPDAEPDAEPEPDADPDAAPVDDDDAEPPAPRRRRRRRTVVTVTVILLIALAAGLGVAVFSGERVSGPSLTDGTPAERLVRAHQRDSAGNASDAIKLYDSVLKSEPTNVEALTYKGWLLARAGLGDLAIASLDQAIAINPKYPDPHFFRGVVIYRDRGDPGAAIPEFETFLANNPPPDSVDAVKSVLDQARQDLAQKNNPSTTTTPAPPPPTPAPPPPPG
ncbi:MAG: tetratricopeptide repeat protein [Actinomycetota bacterium]|nr:tetratricopeptide repeat protein [Actinomycetota bacterium]